jgi:hypothetical protein
LPEIVIENGVPAVARTAPRVTTMEMMSAPTVAILSGAFQAPAPVCRRDLIEPV